MTLETEYQSVLHNYLQHSSEDDLLRAYDLGKRFQTELVGPDELIGIHVTAIEKLLPASVRTPDVMASFALLIELMVSYGLAHLEDVERERHERLVTQQLLQLQAMDKLKDDFLGILSHELRTPLNAIMGFTSILEDGLAGPLSETQLAYTAKILDGSEILLSLVDDLLDLTRVQAGRFSLDKMPMDLTDTVKVVLIQLGVFAARRGIELRTDVEADLPWVVADPRRARQILVNLVENALKFTAEGGQVCIRARTERGHVLLEVEDTGIGIAAADQLRIFTKFTQLDMSATRGAGGTGLGLAIVEALVAAHEGKTGVRSEVGHGSTFWFTLPLASRALC